MDDAELTHRMNLAELEHRCVELGQRLNRIAGEAGYTFDAETFVVSEIIRASIANDADPERMLEVFAADDFIRRATAQIAA